MILHSSIAPSWFLMFVFSPCRDSSCSSSPPLVIPRGHLSFSYESRGSWRLIFDLPVAGIRLPLSFVSSETRSSPPPSRSSSPGSSGFVLQTRGLIGLPWASSSQRDLQQHPHGCCHCLCLPLLHLRLFAYLVSWCCMGGLAAFTRVCGWRVGTIHV